MKERRFSFGTSRRTSGSGSNPWSLSNAFRKYRRTRPCPKIGRNEQAKAYGMLMGSDALVRQWTGGGAVPLYLLRSASA